MHQGLCTSTKTIIAADTAALLMCYMALRAHTYYTDVFFCRLLSLLHMTHSLVRLSVSLSRPSNPHTRSFFLPLPLCLSRSPPLSLSFCLSRTQCIRVAFNRVHIHFNITFSHSLTHAEPVNYRSHSPSLPPSPPFPPRRSNIYRRRFRVVYFNYTVVITSLFRRLRLHRRRRC